MATHGIDHVHRAWRNNSQPFLRVKYITRVCQHWARDGGGFVAILLHAVFVVLYIVTTYVAI